MSFSNFYLTFLEFLYFMRQKETTLKICKTKVDRLFIYKENHKRLIERDTEGGQRPR